MQQSELVGMAVLLGFFLLVGAGAGVFAWRASKLRHEERLRMIEKGMMPPPMQTHNWPAVKQQENQLRFEERRLMIEKGLVPPAEWSGEGKRWRRDDFLRRGLITFFLGIGLGITYYLRPEDTPALAFVSPGLALFGLGCLTYYALSKHQGGNVSART